MPLCCVECKPCNGHCLPGGLFKSRRPTQQLRRAFGKMKVGCTRRRPRRPGSFSSVRAVFWPLMSMRSEADARTDDTRPPTTESSPDVTVSSSSGARAGAPPPSMQDSKVVSAPGRATSTTTARARVLPLQSRVGGEDERPRAPPPQLQLQLTAVAAAAGDEAKATVVRHGGVEAAGDEAKATVVRHGGVEAAGGDEKKAIVVRHGGVEAAAGDEAKAIVVRHGGVEAACRSFERHLTEMLVEGKLMDLTDVEELLCCWEKLRCPAFVRLVGRFYGELCMDLFSSAQDADDVWSSQSEEDLSV